MDDSTESLDLVNSSGFLFQIRVAHELARVYRPGRSVVAQEFRWVDPQTGKDAYVDIIYQLGWARLVIECKRVLNGRWVFLVPEPRRTETDSAILLGMRRERETVVMEWFDWNIHPPSYESSFCVIRGQEKDRPMLETLAALVLRSTEAVSEEATSLETQNRKLRSRCYLPVIVTNARLEVCVFDPSSIDGSGRLPVDAISTVEVPMVRFRKTLTSRVKRDGRVSDLGEANANRERTVFVMNSESLEQTLDKLIIPPY